MPAGHFGVAGGFAFQAELARTSSATGLFLRLGRRRLAVARADEHAPGGGRYSSFGTPAHLGGRRAAFVARPGMVLSPLGRQPDVVVADLRELVDRLSGA